MKNFKEGEMDQEKLKNVLDADFFSFPTKQWY